MFLEDGWKRLLSFGRTIKRDDEMVLMGFTFQMTPSQRQESRGEEVVHILAPCHPIMSWQDTEMKHKSEDIQLQLPLPGCNSKHGTTL